MRTTATHTHPERKQWMIPEPNGKPRLFTKNTSRDPANDGKPGIMALFMIMMITPLIAIAAMMPFLVTVGYFLK